MIQEGIKLVQACKAPPIHASINPEGEVIFPLFCLEGKGSEVISFLTKTINKIQKRKFTFCKAKLILDFTK